MKNPSLILFSLFVLMGCSPKIALKSSFYSTDYRLGIMIRTQAINSKASFGGPGVLAIASLVLTPSHRYEETIQAIDSVINPEKKLKEFYKETFSAKGKAISFIDNPLNEEQLKDFYAYWNANDGKKYFRKDLRFLRQKYQIEELMIVDVVYGMGAEYVYGVETNRHAVTSVSTQIINLNYNELLYKNKSASVIKIKGNEVFTPTENKNLVSAIAKTSDQAIEIEKGKL